MSETHVFALSDGSLYSVDKQTEEIRTYSRQSGLHETGIACIYYDTTGKQLIIAYSNGKLDLLSSRGVKYLGELYDKDMTQRKTIYNVTIVGRVAYLSTHYGIQTLDLRDNKLADSYWLRPGGVETPVEDIVVANDSMYAFTTDSMFCAALNDNLVDYTVWKRELRTSRVTPDADKGHYYADAFSQWSAGGVEGVIRQTETERMAYKPNGPLANIPYRITASQNDVWVIQGGRWATHYSLPGYVMRYNGSFWTYVAPWDIEAKTGNPAKDFMNIAVDPKDNKHYFVTSYGTGLYEFRCDTLVSRHIADGTNTLVATGGYNPQSFTRLDLATYDINGNLWLLDATNSGQVQCLDADGHWHGITLRKGSAGIDLNTPTGFVVDRVRTRYKWLSDGRSDNMGVWLLNDNGTPWDDTDDQVTIRHSWVDQNSHAFDPNFIYSLMQDDIGRIWVASDLGAAFIDPATDFENSDFIVRPDVSDVNGGNPITSLRVNAICQTPDGRIWLGTQTLGVYVLNPAATEIIAHYTTDNSAIPSNCILSLACNEMGIVYIGSGDGLAEYDPSGIDEGIKGYEVDEDEGLEEGSMLRWRMHLSYYNSKEIAAMPNRIFGLANGSLFSVNRTDGEIEYWSKATGLNGSAIAHIAYDTNSGKLIIAYENGQIDLMDKDGDVTQMPDISIKAGTIAVNINSIFIGSKQSYLGMPFGIVVLDARKGEISDTYYIGDNASDVDVQQLVELGDSLYAFSFDRMYKAALKDNLVDYSFWQSEALPFEQVQQAYAHNNQLYVLAHDSLYVHRNGWHLVHDKPIIWIHESEGKLLVYKVGNVSYLDDEDQLHTISDRYYLYDAICIQGEYWAAEAINGLIHISPSSDEYFHTSGPNSNFGYCMYSAHNQIYTAAGGRWATQFFREGSINVYDGANWRGIDNWSIQSGAGKTALDIVSIAVDPSDPGHFFATSYCSGVFEFRDYQAIGYFDDHNSTLRVAESGLSNEFFLRTDGAMIDKEGNLWVLNATSIGKAINILTPSGQWYGIPLRVGGIDITLETPTGIWPDKRNNRYKWLLDQRSSPKVILFDDGGTPTYTGDDRCVARSSFVDQNDNILNPGRFRCFIQDQKNRIWIGTEKGIITIPSSVDFFTSNACRRIIIPRNDGTNLADYLLGDEQINCMAVDGGNRIWIGTANSGLYLIEDDTITVAHFTENNSLLPSNDIQSIAIIPTTGEVFVGTGKGIASYRSDASEPAQKMSGAYAYPNPVRPEYVGMISITGLMDNTVVNIVDAGGNLVCKTRSHGGTAVWDGKLPDGRRATPGVYSALCNAKGGHTVVKILVIR